MQIRMYRRGQAALEFLSTYGFAFLIILVMVGALTYFGVLKPQNIIPERCILGREFECNDFELVRGTVANANGATLRVQVINQLGNTVTIQAPYIINSSFGSITVCVPTPASIGGGETSTIACNIDNSPLGVVNGATFPAVGEKIKVAVNFGYQELGGAFTHRIQGEVLATLK
jgi:hypothetical protein